MISVTEALSACLKLAHRLDSELIPLAEAAGRTLARPVKATRNQPPFDASAMDGYALIGAEAEPHAMFKLVGESAAGHGFGGRVDPGQCVRIFTGAPLPEGTDRVIIQEDVQRQGDLITLNDGLAEQPYVRPSGADFKAGQTFAPERPLSPGDIALLASMNLPRVEVIRRPEVALLATGDELVMPGDSPGPDQIIASNSLGLAAMLRAHGALPRILPIARDNEASLSQAFDLAAGADLLVTIGGASVGDHDLVGTVAAARGMERAFYKVAMRPGKPLMAGRVDGIPMIGLPGNPVSSMICGQVFILPMLRVMLGHAPEPLARKTATLLQALPQNGPREHYMRAILTRDGITAEKRQDSALLTVYAKANALLVRPAGDPARSVGDTVEYLDI